MTGLIETATFDLQAMAKAADIPSSAAADLAEWLVQNGTPFRRAHELVGAVVRDSVQRRVPLPELVAAHPALGAEAVALLEPGVPVSRRTTPGGAGPGPVAIQIERFASVLRADADRFGVVKLAATGSHAGRGGGQSHSGGGQAHTGAQAPGAGVEGHGVQAAGPGPAPVPPGDGPVPPRDGAWPGARHLGRR